MALLQPGWRASAARRVSERGFVQTVLLDSRKRPGSSPPLLSESCQMHLPIKFPAGKSFCLFFNGKEKKMSKCKRDRSTLLPPILSRDDITHVALLRSLLTEWVWNRRLISYLSTVLMCHICVTPWLFGLYITVFPSLCSFQSQRIIEYCNSTDDLN